MCIELPPMVITPKPESLPFNPQTFGYLYGERDRQAKAQIATFNRMMEDLSTELIRIKEYLHSAYAPLIEAAGDSALDSLAQLGVPANTSSSTVAQLSG